MQIPRHFDSKPLGAFLLCSFVALSATSCGSGSGSGSVSVSGKASSAFASVPGRTSLDAPSAEPASLTSAVLPVEAPRRYRGINLAGGEFGDALPGVEGVDYEWPTWAEIDYYVSKGMNTFRLGFKWERMQPAANGEFDEAYFARLHSLVAYATQRGARVILNPHNFARYYDKLVGSPEVPSAVFADFWRRLAVRYAPYDQIVFNLVNEPHDMPTEQWVGAANAAIAAIRAAGANNEIIVPGNAWTGGHSWNDDYYGTPNAVAMLAVTDPANRLIFEAHQYLDQNAGGASDQCISATIGRERLQPFVNWLRANGKKGFIGEFAGGDNPMCNAAIADMLTSMNADSDVLVGWLWWAGGPKWRPTYPFDLDPKDGKDRPQMQLLLPHLTGA